MTASESSVPACIKCKHYDPTHDFFHLCKLHYVEKVDYINGTVEKLSMICYDVRSDESLCGREGKDFQLNDEYVEQEETLSFGLWSEFKKVMKELFLP